MLSRAKQTGVTLIELTIGLAILAILLFMGIPEFTAAIQNSQNRTAAESVLNGLQLARNEALKRNTTVRFDLTDDTAAGLVKWSVGCARVTAECPATIQSRAENQGAANAKLGGSTVAIPAPTPVGHFSTAIAAGADLPGGVSFNGMGRVVSSGGVDLTRIDITNSVLTTARRYVVIISPGGQIRMCDPTLTFATNSQGCS